MQPPPALTPSPDPVRSSILIVEDEAIVALDLTMSLQEMGYEVVGTAESGEGALHMARRRKPTLVVMDVMLKGQMDGIETAAQIRSELDVPVLFLTSYSDPATVARAARAAPYGFLTKPFQRRELRAVIEVALYKAQVEHQLRGSERWFASTLRCVADGVIVTEADGRVRYLNPVAEKLTGWSADAAAGEHADEVVRLSGDDLGGGGQATRALEAQSVVGVDYARTLVRRDGSAVRVDVSAAAVSDDAGDRVGAILVLREATERLRQEARLRDSEQRFRNAFDFAPLGMALVSLEGRFLQINEALCRFIGLGTEQLLGMLQEDLTDPRDVDAERASLDELRAGHSVVIQYEKRYRRGTDAKTLWSLVSVSLLHSGDEPVCYLYQVHDITERKQSEAKLARLAFSDPLTGLANRARLDAELDRLLAFARRQKQRLAVMFLDLDGFKQVNDSLGHVAGDELLRVVAHRLRTNLREVDCVARLGGDEFVIAMMGFRDQDDVSRVVEKLRAAISLPVDMDGQSVVVTPSIGISLYPENGSECAALVRRADRALYAAKAEGRNRSRFFGGGDESIAADGGAARH